MNMKIIDLSQIITHQAEVPRGVQTPLFWKQETHDETAKLFEHGGISFAMNGFIMGEHTSTHVDAYNHYDPSPDALSVEKIPLDRFITPALCIDLSMVPPFEFIEIEHIESGLQKHGLSIRPGDTFLYYFSYFGSDKTQEGWMGKYAGLSGKATEWLADQGVINIGCECDSIDNPTHRKHSANPPYPAHQACRDRALLNTENLANLEAVVGKRFTFVALPLKIDGGTGSPVRAIAILDSPFHL